MNDNGHVGEGADLLDKLAAFVRRYVAMTLEQAAAVALWIVHTHAVDACEQSPILALTSAEKRSGKSTLLKLLALLTANPWKVITPSEAVVFRKLHANRPTLLLDEVDAIFNPKSGANAEGLRAILNAGNEPGTTVPRCVGPSQQLKDFNVFSAKALAGIKDLPDTVADRAIPVRLQRRAPSEQIDRFRHREVREAAEPLQMWVRSWAEHHAPHLVEARPELPALNDRALDAWEPLLAIADRAGGDWPARARKAALVLSGTVDADDASAGVRLLADTRSIFDAHGVDKIASAELAENLHEIEESPWGEWYGKPISPRGIATLLSHYGIRPRTVRLDDETTAKGYKRDQFEDAWSRYTPSENVTPSQPAPTGGLRPNSVRHTTDVVTDEKPPDPAWIEPCDVVTDKTASNGHGPVPIDGFADADEAFDYYRGKLAEAES
ncbi:MAG TPA: DUF3631 domain-containing protein [Gaiellaceae bacterium]|nr:DUF3631 domain-containing protein [Gaiellaceae bacterium]